jgi:hypothetical protein
MLGHGLPRDFTLFRLSSAPHTTYPFRCNHFLGITFLTEMYEDKPRTKSTNSRFPVSRMSLASASAHSPLPTDTPEILKKDSGIRRVPNVDGIEGRKLVIHDGVEELPTRLRIGRGRPGFYRRSSPLCRAFGISLCLRSSHWGSHAPQATPSRVSLGTLGSP